MLSSKRNVHRRRNPHCPHRSHQRQDPRDFRRSGPGLPARSDRRDRPAIGCRCRHGHRACSRDASRGNDSARTPDAHGHESGRRCTGRVATSSGKDRRGIRLHVPAGSVLRSRGHPLDRRGDARLELPSLDDSESSARILSRETLRADRAAHRRRALPRHARQAHLRPRRRTRAEEGDTAGQQIGRAGGRKGHREGRAERARMARADGAQARIRSR